MHSSMPPPTACPSTAAISGLAGGRLKMPKPPRSGVEANSPRAAARKSAPAEKVPPAPVTTARKIDGSLSKSSTMSDMAFAVAASNAFLASGRLIVMIRIGPSRSVKTRGLLMVVPYIENEKPPFTG
ncbi:hypothetical protein D9M72_595740 [compost metagenome]